MGDKMNKEQQERVRFSFYLIFFFFFKLIFAFFDNLISNLKSNCLQYHI